MIVSMTGFGQAEKVFENLTIKVETRSLNSKQADIKLRIPYSIRDKEYEIRKLIQKELHRGKIDFSIEIRKETAELAVTLDEDVAKACLQIINRVEEISGDTFESKATQLVKMPDVLTSKEQEIDETLWPKVQEVSLLAMKKLIEFRTEEGKQLHADLSSRIKNISDLQAEIESLINERKEQVVTRLKTQLEESISTEKVNADRFEQELIYYLEKYDITEELVRLHSHCRYFLEVMSEENNQGRKLGFITQEIGREVNTIGSKANFAPMQKNVVKMKDEIEKIKEQLLNVL